MKYLVLVCIVIHGAFAASIPLKVDNEELPVLDVINQEQAVNSEVKKENVQVTVEEIAPIVNDPVEVIAPRNVEPLEGVQDSLVVIQEENEIPLVNSVPIKEKLIEIEEKSVGPMEPQDYVDAIKLVSTEDKVEGVNNVVANVKETLKKVEQSSPVITEIVEPLVKEAKTDNTVLTEESATMSDQKQETLKTEMSETTEISMKIKEENVPEMISEPEQEIMKRIDEDINTLELVDSKPKETEIEGAPESKSEDHMLEMQPKEEMPLKEEKSEKDESPKEEMKKEENVDMKLTEMPTVETKKDEEPMMEVIKPEAKSDDVPIPVEVKLEDPKIDSMKVLEEKIILEPKSDGIMIKETVKEEELPKPEEMPKAEEKPMKEEISMNEEKPMSEEKQVREEKVVVDELIKVEEPKKEEQLEVEKIGTKNEVCEPVNLEENLEKEMKPVEPKMVDEPELLKKEEPIAVATPLEEPKMEKLPEEPMSENKIESSNPLKDESKFEESMPSKKPEQEEKPEMDKMSEPSTSDIEKKEMLRETEVVDKQASTTAAPGPVASFIQNALQTVGLAPAQSEIAESDSSTSTTGRPNIIQQIQSNLQNFIGGNSAQQADATPSENEPATSTSTTARPSIITQITNAVNSTLNRPADAQQGPLATFVSNLLGTPSSPSSTSAPAAETVAPTEQDTTLAP